MKLLILVSLAFLASCASVPLSSEEQAVRILRKSDAPADCKEISKVDAVGFYAITPEAAETNLKKRAFALGANLITLDRVEDSGTTNYGTAFKCGK